MPVDNSIAGKDPSQLPTHLTTPGALCGSALAPHPSNSSSCVEFAALENCREDSDDGIAEESQATKGGARTPGADDAESGGALGNGGPHVVGLIVCPYLVCIAHLR